MNGPRWVPYLLVVAVALVLGAAIGGIPNRHHDTPLVLQAPDPTTTVSALAEPTTAASRQAPASTVAPPPAAQPTELVAQRSSKQRASGGALEHRRHKVGVGGIDKAVGTQAAPGVRAQNIELVIDRQAHPILDAHVTYDKFLPVSLIGLWCVGEPQADWHGQRQTLTHGGVRGDGEHS